MSPGGGGRAERLRPNGVPFSARLEVYKRVGNSRVQV